MPSRHITSPDSPELDQLCRQLAELTPNLEQPGAWPAEQLRLCGEAGVFEWFVPREFGGQGWSEAAVVRGYLKLSAACLTTTFVITQRSGAMSRIAASENAWVRGTLLPDLLSGRSFATVGISHLTTSRQHLSRPAMRVSEAPGGFVLDGFSPWVTGGEKAQHIVLGGSCAAVFFLMPRGGPARGELAGTCSSLAGWSCCGLTKDPAAHRLQKNAANIFPSELSGQAGAWLSQVPAPTNSRLAGPSLTSTSGRPCFTGQSDQQTPRFFNVADITLWRISASRGRSQIFLRRS